MSLALLWLAPSACSKPEAPSSRPRPLVVVGLDGASWEQIDRMMAVGELPHLAALSARGVRGDLICLPPLSSPVVWTTFATGHFGRRHNILDHTYPYVAGPKRKITARLRRAPTIWDLASAAGLQVGIYGYFATHPAVEVNGRLVTDRAATGPQGAVYPPADAALLEPSFRKLKDRSVLEQLWSEYLPWPFDPKAVERPEDPYYSVSQVVSGRIDNQIRRDAFYSEVALEAAQETADLFMVYLRMIDHASHSTWQYFDPESFDPQPPADDVALLSGLVPTAYRKADEFLGQLLETVGDQVNVVVLSDHGFGPATGSWSIRRDGFDGVSGNHRPNGVFLAAGPDVEPGTLPRMTAVDVAPTLLTMLDLPVSDELPGRRITEFLSPGFRQSFPPKRTARYRVPWTFSTQDATHTLAEEKEELELLEALGYLEGSPDLAEDEENFTDVDFWAVEARIRNQMLIGEVLQALIRSDRESFDSLLAEVAQHDPELSRNLPRVMQKQLSIWQESFSEPIVAAETSAWLEESR